MIKRNRGFTLIEVLTVAALIAILALIAMLRYSSREKAYRAPMQSDLRSLIVVQESYFDESSAYATNVNRLEYNTSPRVSVKILKTSANGWSAEASHEATSTTCTVYVGLVSPPGKGQGAGKGKGKGGGGGSTAPGEGIVFCTN